MTCIFCKIIKKEIPAKIAFEDDDVLAFHDIAPMAPFHVLVIPKEHFSSLNTIPETKLDIINRLFQVARSLVQQAGHAEPGYRLAMNVEQQGGQTVYHTHLHVLAGKQLGPSLAG